MKNFLKCCFIPVLLLFFSCGSEKGNYFTEGRNEKELSRLFTLLESDQEENKFVIMEQIISIYRGQNTPVKLNLLLNLYVEENPDDPYNAFYLLAIASNYLDMKEKEFAAYYFRKILKNYPDLMVKGMSVHFECLRQLISLSGPSLEKVSYYQRMLDYFPDKVDPGLLWYRLGETYEQCGKWDKSIDAYRKFLTYEDTEIPTEPHADKLIDKKVKFFDSDKKWVHRDLNQLVSRVKYAIKTQNGNSIQSLKAKEFFMMTWKSQETDEKTHEPLEIEALTSPRIRYMRNLDPMSNENEAYLETWGWSVIRTWYFYFRRVNYPKDPELHGGWEWAGIYLGEKL